MKLTELIAIFEQIKEEGKGEYKVFDEGYSNEIEAEDIEVNDIKKRIYL